MSVPARPSAGPAGELLFVLRVPARADRLQLVRAAVRAGLAPLGCSAAWLRDLVIAIDEACQNVVRHAYTPDAPGDMEVGLWLEGGRVVARLRDFAPPVDPARVCPRDLADVRPGGLGTHFIRAVTDRCGFLDPPDDGGNLFEMIKALEHPDEGCPGSVQSTQKQGEQS